MPFLVGETAILSGTSVDVSILIFGFISGILFSLVAFCLAREFLARTELALLVSILAAISPRFLDTTYWVGSARGLLVVLFFLGTLLFLRAGTMASRSLATLGLVSVVISFAVHHMAVLFLGIGVAYILSIVVSSVHLRAALRRYRAAMIGFYVWAVATVSVFFLFSFEFSRGSFEASFLDEASLFTFEPKVLSAFLNAAVSYTHQIGVVTVFAFLAIVVYFLRPGTVRTTRRTLMPYSAIICFLPMLGSGLYVSMILLPFVAVLGAYWFGTAQWAGARKKVMVATAIVLVLSSIGISSWSTHYWNSTEYLSGDTVEVDNGVFNDAAYIRVLGVNQKWLSNSDVLSLQLSAVSGAYFVHSGIRGLLAGDTNPDDVVANASVSKEAFPENMYNWIVYTHDLYRDYMVQGLFSYGVSFFSKIGPVSDYASDYFQANSKILIAVDVHHADRYAGRWSVVPSELHQQLVYSSWSSSSLDDEETQRLFSYLLYSSERLQIFGTEFVTS